MGWEWSRLGSLSFDSADGPFGSNLKREHYTSNREVRIIQLSNIGEFGWKDSNVRYTTFAHLTNISRSEAFAGDIIIAKMMPAGRAIICPTLESKYVLSSDAVRFSFSTELEKTYLYYAINSPVFIEQVYGEVQGITRVRTSLQKLRSYLLPIPPMNEQKKIVKIVDQLLTLTFNYEKAQDAMNELNDHVKPLLKRSIFQEAIQGRLVEQCETDEPATILLERIREEKEKLVKAGQLKKSALQDTVIFKGDDNKYYENLNGELIDITDQIPFDVPQSWRWVRLKDIGTWGAGATPNRSSLDYYTNGIIPWLKTGELNNGVVLDSIEKVTTKALKECSLRMVNIGDVLIAMYGATIGKLAIAGIQLTTNQACCACTPFSGIYNWYLFYYLMANKETLIEMGAGGAQPNISREKIVQFLFALPPENEQHRIVSKIEKLIQTIS